MIIKEASIEDASSIVALVNSAYRGDSSRKGWTTEADLLDGIRVDDEMLVQYFSEPGTNILKCTDFQKNLLGCVYLKQEEYKTYLGMLTVRPDLQDQGIGKLLLKAAEEMSREKGSSSILMTVITIRHELIDWYKRQGYLETGEKQPFPADERFGKPKVPLEFLVLEKCL